MSSVFENIIGMVLVIITLLLITILISTGIARNALQQGQQRQLVFGEEQSRAGIGTILKSTENSSKQTMEALLGMSISQIETTVTNGIWTVDLPAEMQVRLDALYGDGKYYFTVAPMPKGINLQFVVDPSPSVSAERETIANNLLLLQSTLKSRITNTGNEQVNVQVFVLPTSDGNACLPFNAQIPLSCRILDDYSMYDALPGWRRPSFGAADYATWQSQPHYARPIYFAESDWAAGSAYAALLYEQDPDLQRATSLNLIFPLSDELSTTSKRDECFNKAAYDDFIICALCDNSCPAPRSQDAVNQAITVINVTKSRVAPIYSVDCDFVQDTSLNSLPTNSYTSAFRSGPGNWCGQAACTACTSGPIAGQYCYQYSCADAFLRPQMQLLADGTNGELFFITDPAQIPDRVVAMYDTLATAYSFTLGARNESRDRFVYNEIVRLPNGEFGRITLWVYR